MALKTKLKEIDGKEYFVSQLPPLKSIRLFTKVAKTLGPALKGLGKSDIQGIAKTVKSKKDVDLESSMEMIAGLTEGLDEDRVEDLIQTCVFNNDYVKQNGKIIVNDCAQFDSPLTILKVVLLVLEVNFKDFLPGLGSSITESPSD